VRRRAEEEGEDTLFVLGRRRNRRLIGAIRARDVRAADLQEEPTSRIEPILRHDCFVGSDEDGGSPRTSHRVERAVEYSERSERSNQTETVQVSPPLMTP
jgi:hypothetical protein